MARMIKVIFKKQIKQIKIQIFISVLHNNKFSKVTRK